MKVYVNCWSDVKNAVCYESLIVGDFAKLKWADFVYFKNRASQSLVKHYCAVESMPAHPLMPFFKSYKNYS